MEIFQDEAFPNLKYHLFQVIWYISALEGKFTATNETFCGKRHIYLGIIIFGHI